MKKYLLQFVYILMIVISGFGLLALVVAMVSSFTTGQDDFLRWSLMSLLPTPILIISVFTQWFTRTRGIELNKKLPHLIRKSPNWQKKGLYIIMVLFVVLLVAANFSNQVYSLVGALLLVNYFSLITHWSGMKE